MPCMCGDPYCSSCGPAQGNFRCPVCLAWGADGGCENPEKCEAEMKEIARIEAQLDAAQDWYEEHGHEIK